jgi:hypothetical protein
MQNIEGDRYRIRKVLTSISVRNDIYIQFHAIHIDHHHGLASDASRPNPVFRGSRFFRRMLVHSPEDSGNSKRMSPQCIYTGWTTTRFRAVDAREYSANVFIMTMSQFLGIRCDTAAGVAFVSSRSLLVTRASACAPTDAPVGVNAFGVPTA